MALSDILSSRLAGPAGRVLDAPIRALVHEVLREQGYASPSEVQALRDDARELSGRVSRAESKLADLSRAQEATVAELKDAREALRASQGALSAAQAELAEARAALAAAPAPSGAAPVVAPLQAAPKGACSVPDCGGTLRSKGFCSAHYQQWRRGTLDGFVGLDGHLTIGKHTFRVSDDHAGKAAVLEGGAVKIGGKTVAAK
jgi:multidrug efflux pump subunit AcrA (membrane-fusion protein)